MGRKLFKWRYSNRTTSSLERETRRRMDGSEAPQTFVSSQIMSLPSNVFASPSYTRSYAPGEEILACLNYSSFLRLAAHTERTEECSMSLFKWMNE